MKRFILAACFVSVCATLLNGQLREDDPSAPSIDPRLDLLADPTTGFGTGDELGELRSQYVELMRANAESMSAEE